VGFQVPSLSHHLRSQGKVPLGAISQSFFSFNHVLTDLSLVVNEFTGPNGLSSFSAQVVSLPPFISYFRSPHPPSLVANEVTGPNGR